MSDIATAMAVAALRKRATYPWQWPSWMADVPLTQALATGYDVPRMRAELELGKRESQLTRQAGPHHNGGWDRMGLVSPSGNPLKSYGSPGEKPAKTAVLRAMPYIESIIDGLDAPVRAAVVSVMQPGARVRWHRDLSHSIDLSIVRLHLSIETNPAATLELGHELTHWSAGTLWYGDFSFPHRVVQDGLEPRTHLMIDIDAKAARGLFSPQFLADRPRRRIVRALSTRIFDFSEKLHAEGRYAARFRRERDAQRREGAMPGG